MHLGKEEAGLFIIFIQKSEWRIHGHNFFGLHHINKIQKDFFNQTTNAIEPVSNNIVIDNPEAGEVQIQPVSPEAKNLNWCRHHKRK